VVRFGQNIIGTEILLNYLISSTYSVISIPCFFGLLDLYCYTIGYTKLTAFVNWTIEKRTTGKQGVI
jgi:hypothetical protein